MQQVRQTQHDRTLRGANAAVPRLKYDPHKNLPLSPLSPFPGVYRTFFGCFVQTTIIHATTRYCVLLSGRGGRQVRSHGAHETSESLSGLVTVSRCFIIAVAQLPPNLTLKLLVWRTPCFRRRFNAGGLEDLFPALPIDKFVSPPPYPKTLFFRKRCSS